MNHVQSAASASARLNRFYPALDRYASLLSAAARMEPAAPAPCAPAEIALRIAPQDGSAPLHFGLKRGSAVYFAARAELGRLAAGDVLRPLIDAAQDVERAVWTRAPFAMRAALLPGQSLADLIAAPGASRAPALAAAARELARLGVWQEVEELAQGLHTPLDRASWQALSAELRASAFVLALRGSDGPVVFLCDALLRGTPPRFQREALALLGDRVVVLMALGPLASDLDLPVLVARGATLAGVWDRERYQRSAPRSARGEAEALADDEELEEVED
jgi:hypothetical protein